MNVEKIHALIDKSSHLYKQRMLDKAAKNAQRALELSNAAEYQKGIISSNLLLACIFNVSGRYKSDPNQIAEAILHLEQANQLTLSPNNNGSNISILLTLGEAFENKRQSDEALSYYKQVLELSREQQRHEGIIGALCGLSRLKSQQNKFDEAFDFTSQSLKYLKENGLTDSKPLLAEIYNQLCVVLIKRQEYSRILEYGQPLLEISRELGDVEKELHALRSLAIYHGVANDFKTAMRYSLEALEKSKLIGYRNFTAHCHINIGTIYASLFNYNDAIERYENVLDSYKDDLDVTTLTILYNNTGYIRYITDEFGLAHKHFTIALQLAEENAYHPMIAHCLAQLSQTELALGMLDEAFENAQRSQEMFKKLGDVNGKQLNMINLGNIYYHKNEFDLAIKLISQGIVLAKRMQDSYSEIKGYKILAKVYERLKNFEKALKYHMVYSNALEEYANLQRGMQVIDMEIKYANKEKQKEIESLTRENEYQALLLQQSDQIASKNALLLQVNDELRQFAYVVSHDLKEPLRMIGSYTQLIHRQHKALFDEDSHQYFIYVNEGVNRMNNLLDALLRYATIGKAEDEAENISLTDILEIAVINLRVRIEETNAVIEAQDLPDVYGNHSLLIQLFQNLISNAIKFRRADVDPLIKITAETTPDEIIVSVSDNGIGIAPEYKDRIFVIFQRLHNRNKYDGTGIGLAICMKIIQRMKGRMWVESIEGEGANFFVAFPKKKIQFRPGDQS